MKKTFFYFWLLISCALGISAGYLFSAKFCKVTIVKRVGKEIALNQTLRTLMANHTFWNYNYICAEFFNNPNKEAIYSRFEKNLEDLSRLFAAYYDKKITTQLTSLLLENSKILPGMIQAAQNGSPLTEYRNAWRKNTDTIATLFADLNPQWSSSTIKAGFDGELDSIIQQIEALAKNNWPRAIEIFDKHLDYAMQFADEFNKGITEQFPHKF